MSNEGKVREFWVECPDDPTGRWYDEPPREDQSHWYCHVIEHSAYQAVCAERDKAYQRGFDRGKESNALAARLDWQINRCFELQERVNVLASERDELREACFRARNEISWAARGDVLKQGLVIQPVLLARDILNAALKRWEERDET